MALPGFGRCGMPQTPQSRLVSGHDLTTCGKMLGAPPLSPGVGDRVGCYAAHQVPRQRHDRKAFRPGKRDLYQGATQRVPPSARSWQMWDTTNPHPAVLCQGPTWVVPSRLQALSQGTTFSRAVKAPLKKGTSHPLITPPGFPQTCQDFVQKSKVIPPHSTPLTPHNSPEWLALLCPSTCYSVLIG